MAVYDPVRGKQALDAMLPHLEAVDEDKVGRVSSDLQGAAVHALAVAEFCARPEIRERFELLDPGLFDLEHVDKLADLAWAAWYIKTHIMTAMALEAGTMLPADLIDRASERKYRMIRLVDYYLSDDDDTGPEIEAIRRGSGYRDLASDLTRLAELYDEHQSAIENDTKQYRATESDDARADAAEILRYMSGNVSDDHAMWHDRQGRIWVLLRDSYGEVAAAGKFLFRHDGHKRRFSSLISAGRRPPRPTRPPEPIGLKAGASADEPDPGAG